MTDCLTNRRTDCDGKANRKPSSRKFPELLSLSREVRTSPFHIAHWTAQHPVGEDDILGVTAVTVVAVGTVVTDDLVLI